MFTSFLLMAVKKGPYARGARRTRDAVASEENRANERDARRRIARTTDARRDATPPSIAH